MNKNKRKILLTKILPKAILLVLIILGLIGMISLQVFGKQVEKENDKWFQNPKNQPKIEKALKKLDQNKVIYNIKDLSINTYDWEIVSLNNSPTGVSSIYFKKGINEVLVMSYPQNRFETLASFSNAQRDSFMENYTIATPLFKERLQIVYLNSATILDVYQLNLKGQKINIGLLNFSLGKNYYHISHYLTNEGKKIIDNIHLSE